MRRRVRLRWRRDLRRVVSDAEARILATVASRQQRVSSQASSPALFSVIIQVLVWENSNIERERGTCNGKRLWGWSKNILFEIEISQLARFYFHRFPNKRSSSSLAYLRILCSVSFRALPRKIFNSHFPFFFFFRDKARERSISLLRFVPCAPFQLIDSTDRIIRSRAANHNAESRLQRTKEEEERDKKDLEMEEAKKNR